MHDFMEISHSTISLNTTGQISLATHIRDRLNTKPERHFKSALNPLLSASYPLLAYASRLQLLPHAFEAATLQTQLINHLQDFETQCQHQRLHQEQIHLARYFLCSLLDDVIEHGPSTGFDNQYTLLMHYHQESLVDNRFFSLIDRLKENPAANLFLLELAYMTLIYGYTGPYRHAMLGSSILDRQDELYYLIRWQQGDFRKNLFMTLSAS